MPGKLLPHIVVVIALFCLIKLAFFGNAPQPTLVPEARADGAIVEWTNSTRMVTTGDNGSAAYVWDFTNKATVRKYYLENNRLRLKVYELDEAK